MALGFAEMLLSKERGLDERGLGVGLGIADGLPCPEGALEGRGVNRSKTRARKGLP